MWREKLYNLHKTTYFIVALFVFKMGNVLRDQILGIAKLIENLLALYYVKYDQIA
jgi:hypothetical protein